ncbi:MAG: cell division protein ZapE [Beijerinckiaceae bacterium]|nr:cell division protein ZapE [Beijerinckiaceae bacterium]
MPNSAAISLIDHYDALVATGAIERDPAQALLVRQLENLALQLGERALASKGRALGWLFARGRPDPVPVKGLYVWGSVGRGKTMLMDMFFTRVRNVTKRRAHFHTFMADVHARIHAFRQQVKAGQIKDGDPIAPTARAIAAEADLLCFDEFTVTDIADAMILGRLFSTLFAEGVTLVATSNVEPSRLYEGGLNRTLFMPFVTELVRRVDVVQLDARTDFRLEKLAGAQVYHQPLGPDATAALDEAFIRLTGQADAPPVMLTVLGHTLTVPHAAFGVARASFEDLCAQTYGAQDYLALARRFHTLVLDNVPLMQATNRNEAKRFIILIDTLYENRVKLIVSAAAEPHKLYHADHGHEAFEFDRTASRLIEMRGEDYLALPHGRGVTTASSSSTGLVET